MVFRHEQTLSKPKADRLNLLRATRAHFGQIFMLYSDPAGEIDVLCRARARPKLMFGINMACSTRFGGLQTQMQSRPSVARCATRN